MTQVNRLQAAMLAGMMLVSTTATAQPADQLPSVSITGKRAVGIFAPASAICENAVAADPLLAQQIINALGVSLAGPTFYQQTRYPRNPDYTKGPTAAPESALPDISFKWVSPYRERTTVGGRDATMDTLAPQPNRATSVITPGFLPPIADDTTSPVVLDSDLDYLAQATRLCRSTYGSSGYIAGMSGERDGRAFYEGESGRFAPGRYHIALRDKTLPMGFALFDQGRYPEALGWFEKAYDKLVDEDGGDEASLMIGKIYLQGLGERSDTGKAIFWLKRAAGAKFDPTRDMPVFNPLEPDRNTAIGEASMILANIYLSGFGGVQRDTVEARKWLARAEHVGHVSAGKTLGDLYLNAKDAPRQPSLAVAAYKRAATLDYPPAQVALADLYYRGDSGVQRNLRLAMVWYSLAAKYEHPDALHALAVAYDTGEGLAADPEKAKVFYKAAAVNGNADAQAALGTYLYEGSGGLARDHVAARGWFEQAAIKAQTDAMYNLGVMTMKGEGGPKDNAKAWAWLKMAERGGNRRATPAVAVLERTMTPAEKQRASGFYTPRRS